MGEEQRTARRRRDPVSARAALVDAAARLLVERPPTAITGRELATAAGVNYGLVHHYFGGKDGALEAGLLALREDYIRTRGGPATAPFLPEGHPYFKALVRSQVDYPDALTADKDYPALTNVVNTVAAAVARVRGPGADRDAADDDDGGTDPDTDAAVIAEAKARAIAATLLQIAYGAFSAALLDAARVTHRERPVVEAHLAALYEQVLLRDGDDRRQ